MTSTTTVPNRARSARRLLVLLMAALAVIAVVVGGLRIRTNLTDDTPAAAVRVTDPGPEHLGEIATQGDDYSKVLPDNRLLVCDEEADGNVVEATAEVFDGARTSSVKVTDATGADGGCLAVPLDGDVVSHWICERNHVAWHCGNKQTGS